MKNFLIFITLIVIAAGLWNDFTNGSLPRIDRIEENEKKAVKAESKSLPSAPYEEIEVKAGDTVLSILASLHGGQLPADLETAMADFQKLNNGVSPDNIRLGARYKFPLYEDE
ncbi:LysM peptidoglycan-binding domain-containing protein [Bacillus sp. FJAT-27231]|uniref:LysM peptidoglycan-binding domain-containing protein n=1 Tax=Bacillus sp. FJAT-27231 TaxID=1679168 RepID=UPI00067138D0|nr:LysM domain-containing protein [Bacillus sp. FJAT-27231]